MTKTMKALELDERIAYSPRAGLVITLQRVRPSVYAVTTMAGPRQLGDWTRSYATEIEARSAARHVAILFREWGNEPAINAARNGLMVRRMGAMGNRSISAARRNAILAETETALDAMMTLHDRAAYLEARTG